MASNEGSSVPARLKDLKDLVKERFLGLLGIRQPKVLLEDEQEVFLQVGRTVWHAPRQLRVELWLSSLARRHSLVSDYQTYLSQDVSREASNDIEKDVQRTFPNTRRFHAEEGQSQLRNVLRAYAAYDPEVAYCQGMNFLTGLLLMYLPSEAHAFAALVVLMEDRKLRSFYHRSMALLQVQLWQLSRLISPSLNQHLEALGVVPMLYGASWLMTAFSADFPIPFSARIMDVLLADQCECALLKVAAAIMKAVEPVLRDMHDLENVLGHLKIEVPSWDEEDLHDVLTAAFTKPWTSRQLAILRSTEGAETVAQAMDRVMTMNEQLNVQGGDDEDANGEDGDMADARVAVTIPRLQPPPQPSSSFTASPACGTPINGGIYGTGSHGGAGGSPPYAAAVAAAAAKCSSSSFTGGSGGGAHGVSGGGGGGLLTVGSAGGSSPAVWSIPCIHPNVPASPAIQAFRRAHLPSFQAAVVTGGARNGGHHPPLQPPARRRLSSTGSGEPPYYSGDPSASATTSGAADGSGGGHDALEHTGGDAGGDGPGCSTSSGGGGGGEEWGEYNAAVVRQKWRSILRAAPGSTRHVLMHPAEDVDGGADPRGQLTSSSSGPSAAGAAAGTGAGTWHGSSSSAGGAAPAPGSLLGGTSSQPIPVPRSPGGCSRGSSIGCSTAASAFASSAAVASGAPAAAAGGPAAAAAASGKPPLPPRCASFDRGPFSRLSVVAEDPLAVQMGPAAPAPSPRGSMDLHVLGRSGSQHLDGCEEHGLLLCGHSLGAGGGSGAAGGGGISGVGVTGTASVTGDCASGSASATTGGALLSPSGISGAVSPHAISPKLFASSWRVSGGGAGGGGGSDTPTAGYMPLGIERVASGSLWDAAAPGAGGVAVSGRSLSMALPLLVPPVLVQPHAQVLGQEHSDYPLQLASPQGGVGAGGGGAGGGLSDSQGGGAPPDSGVSDMATDIAGDILRMLSAVDTGNANAAYDPRVVLGESMYADSPNKEELKLVRRGSEPLRHLPSSSALAELAAQDLARAQEEAERVRQELEAQLAQQKAAERASCAGAAPDASVQEHSAASYPCPTAASAGTAAGDRQPLGAHVAAEAAAAGSAAGAVASAVSDGSEVAGTTGPGPGCQGGAAGEVPPSTAPGAAAGAEAGSRSEELVFRRPTLYVDGIPMFDPKSLMTDSLEAQVMFTPTVSPGASSYADPHLAGFTPTGTDAVTPSDAGAAEAGPLSSRGGGGGGAAVDRWREPPMGPSDASAVPEGGSGDADPEQRSLAAGTDCEGEGGRGGAASSGRGTVGGGLEGGGAVAQPAAGEDGGHGAADVGGQAGEMGAAPAASASDGGEASCPLTQLPSASEWVDWSQAPPIQATASAVLSLSDLPTDLLDAAAVPVEVDLYGSAGGLTAIPSESDSGSESDTESESDDGGEDGEDDGDVVQVGAEAAVAAATSAAASVAPAPSLTSVSPIRSGASGAAAGAAGASSGGPNPGGDLIDMVSPARSLPAAAALTTGDDIPPQSSHQRTPAQAPATTNTTAGTGTGLSPVPAAAAAAGSATAGSPAAEGSASHRHSHPRRHTSHLGHSSHSSQHQHLHHGHMSQMVLRRLDDAEADHAGETGSSTGGWDSDGSFVDPSIPYGLLPMASSISSLAPGGHCLSFASTVSSVATSVGGGSFSAGAAQAPGSLFHHHQQHHHQQTRREALQPNPLQLPPPQAHPQQVRKSGGTGIGVKPLSTSGGSGRSTPSTLPSTPVMAQAAAAVQPSLLPQPQLCLQDESATAAAAASGQEQQQLSMSETCPASSGLMPSPSLAGGAEHVAVEDGSASSLLPAAAKTGYARGCPEPPVEGRSGNEPGLATLGGNDSAGADATAAGSNGASSSKRETELEGKSPFAGASSEAAAPPAEMEAPAPRPTDGRTGTSTPPAMEPQDSGEAEGDGAEGEVDASPFRAALSPSLAHHIMSAYLRSAQHQQQQEQREMEERLHQQHQQQDGMLPGQQGHGLELGLEPPLSAIRPSASTDGGATTAPNVHTSSGGAAGVQQLPVAAKGGSVDGGGLAPHPAGPVAALVEELSLGAGPHGLPYGHPLAAAAATTSTATGTPSVLSGLASPVLGSPGRVPCSGVLGAAAATAGSHGGAAAKALTPFAVSLDDPNMYRLSAEVLQAMPPPPLPLMHHSDTQALSGFALSGSGSAYGAVSDAARSVYVMTSGPRGGSLRCTSSGDGDGVVAVGGVAAAGSGGFVCSGPGGVGEAAGAAAAAAALRVSVAGGVTGGLLSNAYGHHLGLPPNQHQHHHPAHSHEPQLVASFGSHDLPVSAGGVGHTPPPAELIGGVSGGGAFPSGHPPLIHTYSARAYCSSSSGGGAVPPLLPPPPPPQVPLCQTATLAAAAAAAAAAVWPEATSSSMPTAPVSVPPLLCSSAATVMCVQSSASLPACTPAAAAAAGGCAGGVAAGAAATGGATAPPQPPTWTATFDGVDESPSAGATDPRVGQPRTLAFAFAAEAGSNDAGACTPLQPPPAAVAVLQPMPSLALSLDDGISGGSGGGGRGTAGSVLGTPAKAPPS